MNDSMTDVAVAFYILNATMLILHEIESAYEKEWEILRLPVKLPGFLVLHIPLVILLFYGIIELYKGTTTGFIVGICFGILGFVPYLVHKVFLRKEGCFNNRISNFIIYTNIASGLGTIILTALAFSS